MATPMKRRHEDNNEKDHYNAPTSNKRITIEHPNVVNTFLNWCQEKEFQLSTKVEVKRDGSCAQCGMLAVEDIAEGYCLFQVPRSSILAPHNTDIADLLDSEKSQLTATNQWIPLLISLLHESSKGDASKWSPYLALVPDPDAIDLPMFWDKQDLSLIEGTGVELAVERDLTMIASDFNKLVLPFAQRNSDRICVDNITIEHFKRMVAFVMAYSFTEPADKSSTKNGDDVEHSDDEDDAETDEETMCPPMMVPMADMLNHVTSNNAKLTFGSKALKMVTTRAIKKGEEIYNTYGQVSNLHLMHMYGFAEPYPDNTNDVVEIPASLLLSAARGVKSDNPDETDNLLDSKWKYLQELEIVDEDEMIVLGHEGIINDDICSQILKVLTMSKAEYEKFVENDGWSDAESDTSDADEDNLDYVRCSKLNKEKKQLLKRMCELHLTKYPMSSEEAKLKLTNNAKTLTFRHRYALLTVQGQQMLLHKLIDACS